MGLDIAAYFFEVNSWYFGGLGYASIAPVVPSSMIVLVGGVGMFAHFRPLDCHWHLMLTLDWCTFVISLANVVFCGFLIGSWYQLVIPLTVAAILCFLAGLVPIIRTHWLKKRGMLPARNSINKQEWYYIEEQQAPAPRSYPSFVAPAEPQPNPRRQPSQAMSRAGTSARWSGLSGADTMVFGTVKSDTEAPPYSGPMSPAASVVYPKH
ncbi:hypothetical protein LTR09_004696 [Extremus antarcticus]|uniref:Uncharacterized protein n=1 Tax=Extremus antarcticus TaxID=702011 RepID=A0AAJ0DHX7_9PEZI|nr:hypothetical protein LTR09_004696 [Extremus antarcticus]